MLNATLTQLSLQLAQKKLSSAELTQFHLDRIARLNPELNAFVTVDAARSLAQARAADAQIAAGKAQPLTGIPVAHENIFCAKARLTGCGS